MNKFKSHINARGWIYLLLVLVFGIIVYRDALMPGRVMFTTDDNIGAISLRKASFPHSFFGGWDDSTAAGQPINYPVSFTNLLLYVLSPATFMNWIHTIDLVVGSWFFMLFLRLCGISWLASVLGALLTFWLGSTFFLTYAGHIGKFGVVMCAGIYLYCIERAVRDRSICFSVLAGTAMAGMFVEQSDSALFFATVLVPYTLFRGWQTYRLAWGSHIRLLIPVGLVTVMIGLHAVFTAYSFYRLDKPVAGDGGQSWQELWDYCTQWSWPPAETIEFIAPGYMGWRSGEPSGPYWGALGRAPQWRKEFGPNGMNFKLETFYKGLLPVLFLMLGMYQSLIRKRDDSKQRQLVMFWTVAMAVTFILSCGKYTPFYRIFFELPGVSSIRNPVKFMQITQFAMGFLAAVGLDYWLKWMKQRGSTKQDPDQAVLFSFTKGVFYVAIALSVLAALLGVKLGGSASAFAMDGWQDMARVIAHNRFTALAHAAIMAWIGYGLLRLGAVSGEIKHTSWRHLGWAVIVVVMVDQLMISRRYVQAVEKSSLVSEGALIPAMKQGLGTQRAYLWSPPQNFPSQWNGIYNQWMTILFPYYQIPLINVAQMRMPDDYKAYFAAMSQRPVQMWSQMGLGLILTPVDFWTQIRNDPGLRGAFEPVAGFNITSAGKTGVTTVQSFGQQPAQHVLLRNLKPSDRYALITAWRGVALEQAIQEMARIEPLTVALVDPEETITWPASGEPGRTGQVNVESYRAGRVEMSVSCDQTAVLRAAEKFTPDWKAWVDGVEVPVVRTDGIFLGVLIEPSDKPRDVVIAFTPQRTTLYVQFAGMALSVIALGGAFFVRRNDQNA